MVNPTEQMKPYTKTNIIDVWNVQEWSFYYNDINMNSLINEWLIQEDFTYDEKSSHACLSL
jgi:hypothetical protein